MKVTESSEEYEIKQQLDEQFRSVMDKYKYKRRQIRELQEDVQTMSSAMDTTLRDETAYLEMVQDRKSKIQQLQKDIEDQGVKLERVKKQISRVTREARTAQGAKGPLSEESDMEIREIRDRNRSISKAIGQILQQFPDLTQTVDMHFQQVGLPVPQPPGSRGSSRASSVQSSARSSPRSSISSARSITSPKAVDLTLGLKTTSPGPASGPPSTASSRHSSRSSRR